MCTGLQVVEHCQDVGEDARAGRVYLPADDLARLGVGRRRAARRPAPRRRCAPSCCDPRPRGPATLLDARAGAGAPPCPAAPAGSSPASSPAGLAALDAIERVDGDVLGRRAGRAPAATLARTRRRRCGSPPGRERRRMIAVADAYAECARITAQRGEELRLRHQAARPPAARRDVGGLRAGPAHRRHRRRRPARRTRKLDALGRVRRQHRRSSSGADDDPVLVALADAADRYRHPARRVRSAHRRLRARRPRRRLRDRSTTSSATAASSPARSGGCRSPCSAPTTRSRPSRAPRPSAWPCSSPTSCATSSRIATMGRVYLPARGRGRASAARPTCRARRRRWRRSSPLEIAARRGALRHAASSCCRCSTGAAGRASRRWPGSTAGCWPGSTPTRRGAAGAGVAAGARRSCGSRPAASSVGRA